MPHSRSANKRLRQSIKRRAINRWRKRGYRVAMRDFHETILHGSVDDAKSQLSDLYKKLDQVAAKGTIHKKTADRYKSRLAARLNHKIAQAAPEAASA